MKNEDKEISLKKTITKENRPAPFWIQNFFKEDDEESHL